MGFLKALLISVILLPILYIGYYRVKSYAILSSLQKQIPEDRFYYVKKLHKTFSIFDGDSYRGEIYSDKLKELKSLDAIFFLFSRLDHYKEVNWRARYEELLYSKEEAFTTHEKLKGIFGELIITNNKVIPSKIEVFVDDITKLSEDELKTQAAKVRAYLYDERFLLSEFYAINKDFPRLDTLFNFTIRDKKSLTARILERGISIFFKNDPKVKRLLKKYRVNKDNLSDDELGFLLSLFNDGLFPYIENDYGPPQEIKYISVSIEILINPKYEVAVRIFDSSLHCCARKKGSVQKSVSLQ